MIGREREYTSNHFDEYLTEYDFLMSFTTLVQNTLECVCIIYYTRRLKGSPDSFP